MTDDELRALIRGAIHKHMGSASASTPQVLAEPVRLKPDPHMSFAQYQIARTDGDTMCIVEPAVQCNHCGFCKCHGH